MLIAVFVSLLLKEDDLDELVVMLKHLVDWVVLDLGGGLPGVPNLDRCWWLQSLRWRRFFLRLILGELLILFDYGGTRLLKLLWSFLYVSFRGIFRNFLQLRLHRLECSLRSRLCIDRFLIF